MPIGVYRGFVLTGWLTSAAIGYASDALTSVEKTASDWVKTRAETVRIETEWASERELLASTVDGLKERASLLEDRRDHLRAKTADERAEMAGLNEKKAAGAAELAAAEERLKALGLQVLALRAKLPTRLEAALEFSFKSLESSELSPGERAQLTISVLNRCAQFNGTVTSGEEVLVLEGEPTPKAVETIYWGLSHGYALDRSTSRAWFGSVAGNAWKWSPLPDGVEAVSRLIAIYNDRHDPELVIVPARLAAAK